MGTYFDCIPCMCRQALDAVRFVTDDEATHEQVLRDLLHAASEMDLAQSPPAMGQRIHRWIRQLTGNDDPYKLIKERCNRLALKLYPELKRKVERSGNALETAVRLALAGNVLDSGVNSHLADSEVKDAIGQSLSAQMDADVLTEFREALGEAKDILYLGDNAGEIVFDRLLIEQMPCDKLTFVVRGRPTINDATMCDAVAAGLTDLVEVVDNGSDAPGTILEDCSAAFRKRFDAADLIVAKGQGNYETLSDVPKDIFFLLKAKCPVIASHLGCEVGSFVLRRRGGAAVAVGGGENVARI
ncbi:MAG: DUF89 family protein [Candidatus Brocadiae bacterium]|nr:DUF89 family protein [Candidatus Brocadiia bacterium]